MTTYVVTTHEDEEPYEVEADRIVIDENNTNRVTFLVGEDVVAQENSAKSVRPSSLNS